MKKISSFIKVDEAAMLRALLQKMEQDLGLDDLTHSERDVLYAARLAETNSADVIRSEDIRNIDLISDMPAPTFYKALQQLVNLEFLKPANNSKRGQYKLVR